MAKAAAVSYSDILSLLKKGTFAPVYLFHGEEDYFIDLLAAYIEEHAIDESERAFNQTVVYGRDVTASAIRDVAMRMPMMAPRQVIILREAQEMKELYQLEGYVSRPSPTTVLVICHKHKKVDGRKSLARVIQEKGVVFESKKLYDDKIQPWIQNWLKDQGVTITPEALALANEYLGNQLSTITTQLQKILARLQKGDMIDIQMVRESIGVARDFNVFELQQALGRRQADRVFYILDQMNRDPKSNPLPMSIGSLAGFFIRLYTLHQLHGAREDEMAKAIGINPYLLKDYKPVLKTFQPLQIERILGLLHEYDMRSKGVRNRSADEGALLRELMHGILAA